MAQIKILEKEYQLKYTIESWKKLKEFHDITPINFHDRVNSDFASTVSCLIFYGLSIEDRKNVDVDKLDESFGFDILDELLPAIMETMPKKYGLKQETVPEAIDIKN